LLQSDEIKSICDDHHLSRHEVYNIRSQFASMVKMSKQHDEQLDSKEPANKDIFPGTSAYVKPSQRNNIKAKQLTGSLNFSDKDKESKGGEKNSGTGISI